MPAEKKQQPDDADWEYGDVWKEGSPDQAAADTDIEYVEVLRSDSGKGFDDSLLIDLVVFLGSRGITATYESFSVGMEPAAIKTYVLKAEAGRADEARELADRKLGRK